jgi:hypothetical protein
MRRSLLVALSLTVLLSVWAIWRTPNTSVVAPVRRTDSIYQIPATLPAVHNAKMLSPEDLQPLPAHWDAPTIQAARRNPFQSSLSIVPPVHQVAQVALVAASSALVAPEPAPSAPPLSYRFLGRMLNPQGQRFVYIARGDTVVAVRPGVELQEGYVVESVTDTAIELVYPPLQQHVSLPLPPTPPDQKR